MSLHETRAEFAQRSDARAATLAAAHLSVWGQCLRLKPWTQLALVALIALVALLASWHWQLLLVCALLFAPTLGQLIRWWRLHPEYCPLDHVLSSFLYGLFALGVCAMGTALLASTLFVILISPIFIPFWLGGTALIRIGQSLEVAMRWAVFCLVEELWLLSTLRRAKQRRQHRVGGTGSARGHRAYVLYSSASAVGYSTAQCLALACLVTAIMEGHTAFETKQEQSNQKHEITIHETYWLLGLALLFAWFWLPLRLAASHLNVLELARKPDLPTDPNTCLPLPHTSISTQNNAINENVSPNDQENTLQEDSSPQLPSQGSCCIRLQHLISIIRWSWALRTTHLTQFCAWFYLLALPITVEGIVAWLVTTFICWCVIIAVAAWRVKTVETELEPSVEMALSSANLHALYGFSLLDDAPSPSGADEYEEEDDVANPRAFSSHRLSNNKTGETPLV